MSDDLKTYRVGYVATYCEWYEVEASSPEDAEDTAHWDGVQVDRDGRPCDSGPCVDRYVDEIIALPTGGGR